MCAGFPACPELTSEALNSRSSVPTATLSQTSAARGRRSRASRRREGQDRAADPLILQLTASLSRRRRRWVRNARRAPQPAGPAHLPRPGRLRAVANAITATYRPGRDHRPAEQVGAPRTAVGRSRRHSARCPAPSTTPPSTSRAAGLPAGWCSSVCSVLGRFDLARPGHVAGGPRRGERCWFG